MSNSSENSKVKELIKALYKKYGKNTYDFSHITDYRDTRSTVTVICKHCSESRKPTVYNLLNGISVCKCRSNSFSKALTTSKFVERCIEKYGDQYSYEETNYISLKQQVIIICNSCKKSFTVNAGAFQHRTKYCPHCSSNRTWSSVAIECLNAISEKSGLFVQHAKNLGEQKVCIGKSTYKADGFVKELNLIIEYNGDVFHGNPKLFKDTDQCHPFKKDTAKDLYLKTLLKEQQLKRIGYKVLTIWENDYKTNKDKTINKAIKIINKIKQSGEKK